MGILIENFGIKRSDVANPSSALFDTSDFISRYVGDYRFLCDRKDEKCSFYGAAFCDDERSEEVQKKSYQVMLTGHSLGGSLATMVACASGCNAVSVNGAVGIAVDKFYDMENDKSRANRIYNYMASPKNGHTLCVFVHRI